MTRQYIMLAGVGTVAVALLAMAFTCPSVAEDKKVTVPKDVADTVKKMADDVGKGTKPEDLKKDAAKIFGDHKDEFKSVMWVFKPRVDGGFGVGPKPNPEGKDGIEMVIIFKGHPTRNKITLEDLKANAGDYNRIADITIAMAEVTRQYTPKKKLPKEDPADWVKYNDEMAKSAMDLKAAIKDNKPEDVKKAFVAMYSSCTNCHAIFRKDE